MVNRLVEIGIYPMMTCVTLIGILLNSIWSEIDGQSDGLEFWGNGQILARDKSLLLGLSNVM